MIRVSEFCKNAKHPEKSLYMEKYEFIRFEIKVIKTFIFFKKSVYMSFGKTEYAFCAVKLIKMHIMAKDIISYMNFCAQKKHELMFMFQLNPSIYKLCQQNHST